MAEPFKNLINAALVRDTAGHLQRAWPHFDRARFEQLALESLEALAFKARAEHLCTALQATLPQNFAEAAHILERSLGTIPAPLRHADPDEGAAAPHPGSGVAGWALWAYGEFVARQGQRHPERALACLHAITQRFTAEFAIRPFLVAHPQLSLATLQRWVDDPSAHVRRLVSEGSRPRLPWGLRLHQLVADPTPALPLLAALQDDPTAYVRRSVANHLNDIAKDHPDVLVQWLAEHLPGATDVRRQLLRHASRTLIKAGHPGVMAAWGLGQAFQGEVQVSIDRSALMLGEAITVHVQLRSHGQAAQSLELDYRVHHLKANGQTSPKTFKGKRLTLAPGEHLTWQKKHTFKPISTRRYHPGTHGIDVQINGQVHGWQAFELGT